MKSHSWISYLSIVLAVLGLLLWFLPGKMMSTEARGIIFYVQFIIVPASFILAIVAFFRKGEKKLLPILSVLLNFVTFIIWFILYMFITSYTP
ncbi:hypothetical protein N781_15085 [Pontibacillus halophilus JSM 076056 = DSM 19796]|uniref:Uncharacterized protein n=1 Tax=Pontibacillus halophilus JSM 076056 = DSM 19796 TaxID=1385510 RepID=A0A0A5GNG0_9BACI|nr:hypothetical protein [Pontibacillus halophilus]KGX92788.1 hypothetical protein N781_15085 [Pontibacillus halophilus JSM 076056 = DSM 19796]